MRPLGPFAAGRQVVAGVSGGADSMALALLLRDWGDPLAVVVDHGLRPGSAAEASLTLARLAAIGIPARSVRLALGCGPGLGARAREARYAALFDACRATGRADLVVGHHARDQDETVILRERSGSGPAGLSGMPAIGWRGEARLLRPLLPVPPARLRATLRAAGVGWVEDPGNTDPATARGALRQAALAVQPAAAGPARRALEGRIARELAAVVTLYSTGHASIGGTMSAEAWSALLWTVSGRRHPPAADAVRALAARGGGTLHGVVVRDGLAMREASALAPPVAARDGAVWDGRFVMRGDMDRAELGALGTEARRLRRRPGWPAAVLCTLPALRLDGKLLAVPHLAYADGESCRSLRIDFRPARPLAGASFRP